MKENVIDVLMYLFENYMDEEEGTYPDRDALSAELEGAGFAAGEVDKALAWLDGLSEQREQAMEGVGAPSTAIRVFAESEIKKLDVECRGFLMFLEHIGVLDSKTRELVIDRVMALETDDIDLEQLKWVILMVLFNQPGQEAAFAWMEDLVFDERPTSLH